MVAVAQLVESQIVILVVVGSNPIGHPTLHRAFPTKCDSPTATSLPAPSFLPFRLPASKGVFDPGLNGARHPNLNSACAINDVGLIGQVFGRYE